MKSTLKYTSLLLFTLAFLVSCDCDCEDDIVVGSVVGTLVGAPGSPSLTAPLNNNSCEIGSIVDAFTSAVTFSWSATSETDTYNLTYTNLATNSTMTKTAIKGTSTSIVLFRGITYAWSVQSVNSSSKRGASSGTAKFYLQGNPSFNNVPLAAVLATPDSSGGNVTLTWTGKDPDAADTLSYTLYVDKVDGKQSPVSSGLTTASTNLDLTAGNTYFWRVKSTDQNNNSSFSLISKFSL
jgi:hypothetical protein